MKVEQFPQHKPKEPGTLCFLVDAVPLGPDSLPAAASYQLADGEVEALKTVEGVVPCLDPDPSGPAKGAR